MSIYTLVTIDQRFIAETIARTGSEQLLDKVARSFVGLYSQDENWYIPLRANLGKKKPEGAYFETPFETNNTHFKRPGLDYEKSIFVPSEYTIEIRNTLPSEQSDLIFSKQNEIRMSFENYVLSLEKLDKHSPSYKFSTVPLFPEGIQQIKEIRKTPSEERSKASSVESPLPTIPVEPAAQVFIEENPSGHYWVVDWNEGGKQIGEFAGNPITDEVLDALRKIDADQYIQPGYYKSRTVEVSEGKVISALRIDLGDGGGVNNPYFERIKRNIFNQQKVNEFPDEEPHQESLFEHMIDILPEENATSKLSQAKKKLERLEREYDEKVNQLFGHQKRTNGQPMNDKRNGRSWFNQHERLENSVRNLSKEIDLQKERIGNLLWQREIKELGINKQGGLIMSVDNIPKIKEEIEKFERGDSMYSSVTIQKYKKKLKELEGVQEKIESAENNLTEHAKALINSDEIKQWVKKPTIYFVSGLRKVALELTAEGTFVESQKYPATTEEAKKKIADLLSADKVVTEKIPSKKEERSIQDIIKKKDYKALSSHLKNGISSYLETDTFKNYLNFVSKFHKYSHKNVQLLLDQNPNTTHVAGFKKWKELGRTVNKGAKALYVYAPGSKIVRDKKGEPVKDEKGQVIKEKFFFLTPVFDVSQTNGEPLPKPIHDLEGNFETPEQFVKVFKAIENISPVPIKVEEIQGSARGYYHKVNKEIVVKTGLGEIMTLKTLIHEVTHAKLHADSTASFGDTEYSQHEFEAESVAYIVSNHLGIDTGDYSFGYLSSWTEQGHSIDSFTESLDRITKEAQGIIDSLDKSLALSFAMAEPANKFEERVARAQGRAIQPIASETKKETKESELALPKEQRPRLNH